MRKAIAELMKKMTEMHLYYTCVCWWKTL